MIDEACNQGYEDFVLAVAKAVQTYIVQRKKTMGISLHQKRQDTSTLHHKPACSFLHK